MVNFMQIITGRAWTQTKLPRPLCLFQLQNQLLSPLLSHSEIGGGPSVPTKVQWPVGGRGADSTEGHVRWERIFPR